MGGMGFAELSALKALSESVGGETKGKGNGKGRVEVLDMVVS